MLSSRCLIGARFPTENLLEPIILVPCCAENLKNDNQHRDGTNAIENCIRYFLKNFFKIDLCRGTVIDLNVTLLILSYGRYTINRCAFCINYITGLTQQINKTPATRTCQPDQL